MVYAVEKELPGNSSVTVDFLPYDNQSQRLKVTLIWSSAPNLRRRPSPLHSPLKASAVQLQRAQAQATTRSRRQRRPHLRALPHVLANRGYNRQRRRPHGA